MSLRTNRGFTLIELLAVVAIIILLAAILAPGFGRAMVLARRGKCAATIKDIVRACGMYTDAQREHRGGTPLALPSTDPMNAAGNRQCLWLLVKYDYTTPETLICSAMREQTPATSTDEPLARENCSYSFISMVGRGSVGGPPVLTMENAPMDMVIVGDLNPRWVEATGEFDSDLDGHNSASHGALDSGNEGQNIGRLDGSATWTTKPTDPPLTRPNPADPDYALLYQLYQSSLFYQSTSPTGDTTGQAAADDIEDVFLIP